MEPIIKKRGPFRAVGLRYYGDDSDVVKMAPKLWEQFNKRMSEVEDAVPGCAYGLMCTDIDPVSMEKWDYMACIEVKSFKDIPEEMVEVEVPEQTYAVFTHKGKLDKLRQTYNYIYSEWLPQSNYEHVGKFDFELYDYRFMMDSDESEFEIYISVKPKE